MMKKYTIAIIIILILALIGWDVFAAWSAEKHDTISEVTLSWAKSRPIVAFVLGLLCGHLFWPREEK